MSGHDPIDPEFARDHTRPAVLSIETVPQWYVRAWARVLRWLQSGVLAFIAGMGTGAITWLIQYAEHIDWRWPWRH